MKPSSAGKNVIDALGAVFDSDAASAKPRAAWFALEQAARVGSVATRAFALQHLVDAERNEILERLAVARGVGESYVSVQLGHADVGVTARHCARWAGGDGYRDPMRVEADEVPADLLARLIAAPRSNPSDSLESANYWWSLRESNPCLQGENLIS